MRNESSNSWNESSFPYWQLAGEHVHGIEEKVVIHRCNNKVYYYLSHDVVTLDVDRNDSTAYC